MPSPCHARVGGVGRQQTPRSRRHVLPQGVSVGAVTSEPPETNRPLLYLFIDTSTWLDLAKRRHGQRLLRPLQRFVEDGLVELLVPQVILDEFDRNRQGVEKSMTTSLTERIKAFRKELTAYAEMDYGDEELTLFDQWAHQVSLSGALTTRNFDDICSLLAVGRRLEPTSDERDRVVTRALAKAAPCHRQRNSVADALLIEMYTTVIGSAGPGAAYAFVTTNSDDFSAARDDKRKPHDDLADAFAAEHSTYRLGVDGLEECFATSSATTSINLSVRCTFPMTFGDSTRSWPPKRRCSTRSGMSARCGTTGSCLPMASTKSWRNIAASRHPAGSVSKRLTVSTISVHTTILSWACCTARCQPCVGCSATSGTSSTPKPQSSRRRRRMNARSRSGPCPVPVHSQSAFSHGEPAGVPAPPGASIGRQ